MAGKNTFQMLLTSEKQSFVNSFFFSISVIVLFEAVIVSIEINNWHYFWSKLHIL